MKKKWVRTIALAICSGLLLSGCNGGGTDKITKTADGKTEITFWYSGGKTAANVLDEIINGFNESQELYHVTGVTQANYDETYAKLQAGIASKTAADVVLLDAEKTSSLAAKKLIENLTPYIENDSGFQKDDYIEVFFQQGILEDGTVFAIPAYGTTQIMYYNRELFNKAGIDVERIKTWQDLGKAAEKIAIKENGKPIVYGWEPMWGADNLVDIALSNGGTLLSEDKKTVMISSPEWIEAWEAVRGWIHDDQIMKIHSGGQGWEYWYKTMDDVLGSRAGGFTGSSGDQADLDFSKIGAMEQPGFSGNPSAPVARALQLVMPNNKEETVKDGVYSFMKYVSNPDNQAKWSMATGYVAVRKSTLEVESYKEFLLQNPHASIPLAQSMHGSAKVIDPTGGKIYDALDIAADQVEIENIPVKEALEEAQKTAQAALDAMQQ